jgi:hypothetical protein
MNDSELKTMSDASQAMGNKHSAADLAELVMSVARKASK